MKNKTCFIILTMLLPVFTCAQEIKTLTLEEAYRLARENYPLSKQRELIKKRTDYTLQNAYKGYFPQVIFTGQATYQSDVTEVPIHLPGVNIPRVNKGQYRVYGEVSQVIYDAGLIKQQAVAQQLNAAAEEQQLEVELYKTRERINQLFFGILLIDEQLNQAQLVAKDIRAAMDKVNAAIANGTAIKSNAHVLKAELLKTDQKTIELKSNRNAYAEMLGLFINRALPANVVLIRPKPVWIAGEITRPELLVFEYKKRTLDIHKNMITGRNKPKLGVFLQTGVGNPSPVNMLSNKFSGYYLGGMRFTWSLSGLYTSRNENALLDIRQRTIELQKENFLFNTTLALKQQRAEILKWQQLMQSDEEIISLRKSVRQTAAIQLENGLIQSADYLREVYAEDAAIQNLIIHEIQLLLAQYQYKTTTGN